MAVMCKVVEIGTKVRAKEDFTFYRLSGTRRRKVAIITKGTAGTVTGFWGDAPIVFVPLYQLPVNLYAFEEHWQLDRTKMLKGGSLLAQLQQYAVDCAKRDANTATNYNSSFVLNWKDCGENVFYDVSLLLCDVCGKPIFMGDHYCSADFNMRAHTSCLGR